ncbi:amino-acid racemase [Mycolicibacterium mucogenicum]|uniref:alanine racemase n=1 Tax=Mycolicibacterium mucogenicum TaxID=56689 RepID=UPI002269C7FC|nr:alanine racemase [Mycolicibacterium mucogenicum]MCX8564279.1 amino-acid racemase [Mycolicibacterium mucogenicum]
MRTLLDRAFALNSNMLAAAIDLHQAGAVPSATQLIDLDIIAQNARRTAEAAEKHGLRVYAMTKQNGLNPFMTKVMLECGIPSTCAVETLQAHRIHRYGFPLGNVGHIQNIPAAQVPAVVAMRPEFITVYTYEAAARASAAATRLGVTQRLYVRVTNQASTGTPIVGVDDGAFSGLVGGWTEDTCVSGIQPLLDLPNIEVAGLTQFSAIGYGETGDPSLVKPTEAFFTMLRAKELLEKELGLVDLHLNVGGNANVGTFPVLASYGVTEVEPGVSLAGSGGFHAKQYMAELPAQVVVTEVSHYWGDNVYTAGGVFNFVSDLYDPEPMSAAAGTDLDSARGCRIPYLYNEMVDAHGVFGPGDPMPAIGDTVLVVHHPQAFLERGYTAAVSGIATGNPRVEGVFDAACNQLDETFNVLPLQHTLDRLDAVGRSYRDVS